MADVERKSRRRKTRRLEAALMLLYAWVAQALPMAWRAKMGRAVGRISARLAGGRRRIARENVESALGLDSEAAERVALESFAHFGRVFTECLSLPRYGTESASARFETEGWEHLRDAHALGRGVIVFSAHFGNWELVALQQALAGIPMDFIARPLDNPWVEKAFFRWRGTTGNRVLGKHGSLRKAVKSLREGRALAILIDQNVRSPPRLFFDFFGMPASVTPTLATLALRLDVPVVPVSSYPRDDGGYLIRYGPRLMPPEGLSDEETVVAMTGAATREVEAWIRERPDLWLWFHNRWKTKPRRHDVVHA